MVSDAKKRANARWNAANYDRLAIQIPKGERDLLKNFAASAGLSMAQFIRTACYEKAGRVAPPMK